MMNRLSVKMISAARAALIMLVILLPLAQARGQQKLSGDYHLVADVHQLNAQPGKIYFWYDGFDHGEKVTHQDSAQVKNGRVEFNGTINEPHEAFLCIKPRLSRERVREGDRLNFYLTPGTTKITAADSLNSYVQTGGSFQQDYRDFEKVKSFYDHKVIALAIQVTQQKAQKDTTSYRITAKAFDDMVNFYADTICKNWAVEHASSPVALLPLRWYAGSVIKNPDGVDAVYQQLSDAVKALPAAADLKRRVDNVLRSAVGHDAPSFTMTDTAGKPVSLQAYRGKYVLLDFWASWCAPCRRENPNVIANFNKHHNQNFVVISVSLDSPNGKNAWLKAIRTDGMGQWPNLSDLKGFNNQAALLYGVQAVPQNFLIDPNGVIIAKNLLGEALTQQLEEVLTAKNH